MSLPRERACRLEELSDFLLRYGQTDTWRAVFVGQSASSVNFQHRPLTVLCSDDPSESIGDPVVSAIAHRCRGTVQYGSELPVALSFEEPSAAVRAAVALHRLAHGRRLRTAVKTGVYASAVLHVRGERRTILLGDALAPVDREAVAALPGSIRISPETYRLVDAEIAASAADAMIVTEVEGDDVFSATLMLPPSRASDQSTFAGLGLT